MPHASRLLAGLRSRRIGYARLDEELIIRDLGGCVALWGDCCGQPVTAPLPELLGMRRAIIESIAAGEELALPLIERGTVDSSRYLDVVIQPDAEDPGASTVWLIDTTQLGRLAEAYGRALAARASAPRLLADVGCWTGASS